jgi:hypothetical protein
MAFEWWRNVVQLTRATLSRKSKPRRRRPQQSYRPSLIELEDRVVPTTVLVPGPTVDVTRLAGNQDQPWITVDPTNTARLAVIADNGGAGLAFSLSQDGGVSWQTKVIANGNDGLPAAVGNAQAAFDTFGNLFISYEGSDPQLGTRVNLIASYNDGTSFVNLGSSGLDVSTSGIVALATGAGQNGQGGSVWVAWSTSLGGEIAAEGAKVTGRGAVGALNGGELVPDSPVGTAEGTSVSIAIGPVGQVAVAWQQVTTTSANGPSSIFTSLDPDGLGNTFGFQNPVLTANTNVGTSQTNTASQPLANTLQLDASPRLAFDNSNTASAGKLYLVYVNANSVGSKDMSIQLYVSGNNGQTWSPFNGAGGNGSVNDTTNNSRFDPAISVDPGTGYVAVTWYDARNSLGTDGSALNTEVQYWGTVSTDGGQSFAPNTQISAGTTSSIRASSLNGLGTQTGIVFQNGVVNAVWADNSATLAGNPSPARLDIAFATAQPGTLGGTPPGGVSQFTGFIEQAYLDILGRAVDPAGLVYWTSLLNSGAPRAVVPAGLVNSLEYQTKTIDQMYRTYLDRPVDSSGLAFGLSFYGKIPLVSADVNFTDFLKGYILSSSEYFADAGGSNSGYLTSLFRDLFGRGVDPNAAAFYGGQLASGASRLSVEKELQFSSEAINRQVNALYVHYLRRNGDAPGVGFFGTLLLSGGRMEDIIVSLVASDEYLARIP